MKDISVIIAHRDVVDTRCLSCNDTVGIGASSSPMGLWYTLQSIQLDLEDAGYDYEVRLYINGATKIHSDTRAVLHYLEKTGRLAYKHTAIDPVAPPLARQAATKDANGKYLFFFDNHIIVKPGYFERAIESMKEYNMDMLHSTTRFYHGQPDTYHYGLHLEKNFWADAATVPSDPEKPYKVAAGGHGGFVVRKDVWEEVGGYGWDNFRGYGGEEMYFDLKMWMLGKNNWLDPQLVHYHYAGNRGYRRHNTDDFFINMMAVANIIGGESWMNTVQGSFIKHYSKMQTGRSIFELSIEAYERSKEHAEWLAKRRLRTLDEQLEYFKKHNVAC
jgi:hypothetical protein